MILRVGSRLSLGIIRYNASKDEPTAGHASGDIVDERK